ncbi:basic proline-rich protein-like [Talpa occidentalis]|uniref:basic proline-rich protein-like n=1 Tax=Talpa occidentalis TaxID=50954 RepID=UPI00188E6868|nr:basic proline-rich protein-like [Talpa occidentalis]
MARARPPGGDAHWKGEHPGPAPPAPPRRCLPAGPADQRLRPPRNERLPSRPVSARSDSRGPETPPGPGPPTRPRAPSPRLPPRRVWGSVPRAGPPGGRQGRPGRASAPAARRAAVRGVPSAQDAETPPAPARAETGRAGPALLPFRTERRQGRLEGHRRPGPKAARKRAASAPPREARGPRTRPRTRRGPSHGRPRGDLASAPPGGRDGAGPAGCRAGSPDVHIYPCGRQRAACGDPSELAAPPRAVHGDAPTATSLHGDDPPRGHPSTATSPRVTPVHGDVPHGDARPRRRPHGYVPPRGRPPKGTSVHSDVPQDDARPRRRPPRRRPSTATPPRLRPSTGTTPPRGHPSTATSPRVTPVHGDVPHGDARPRRRPSTATPPRVTPVHGDAPTATSLHRDDPPRGHPSTATSPTATPVHGDAPHGDARPRRRPSTATSFHGDVPPRGRPCALTRAALRPGRPPRDSLLRPRCACRGSGRSSNARSGRGASAQPRPRGTAPAPPRALTDACAAGRASPREAWVGARPRGTRMAHAGPEGDDGGPRHALPLRRAGPPLQAGGLARAELLPGRASLGEASD